MERKTISLPDELAEFVEENHINLSRFVQDKLEELAEGRDQGSEKDLTEEEVKEIGKKLEKLGYMDR